MDANSKLVIKTKARLNQHWQKKFSDGIAIRKTRLPVKYMPDYLVASSNLYGVDYEPWSGTLTITFHSGSVYEYYGVPTSVCNGLLTADSPGRFHHENIKNNYSYRRIQ
jgi:hypothetical protein